MRAEYWDTLCIWIYTLYFIKYYLTRVTLVLWFHDEKPSIKFNEGLKWSETHEHEEKNYFLDLSLKCSVTVMTYKCYEANQPTSNFEIGSSVIFWSSCDLYHSVAPRMKEKFTEVSFIKKPIANLTDIQRDNVFLQSSKTLFYVYSGVVLFDC